MEGQRPVSKLLYSDELEKAAKAYFDTDGSPEYLADRVEAHTNWDGELNEIVHYSKKGVNGRDILIHVMLSDDLGSDENKLILFGKKFAYLGIKIGLNNTQQYCVIMDFASQLGDDSNKKFTSTKDYNKSRLSTYDDFTSDHLSEASDYDFSYDIGVVRKVRNKSRRKVKYDKDKNLVTKVYQPRVQTSLEYPQDGVDESLFRTYHVPRMGGSKSQTAIKSTKYYSNSKQIQDNDLLRDKNSSNKARRASEFKSKDFKVLSNNPSAVSLRGIVNTMNSKGNRRDTKVSDYTIDTRYGRSQPKNGQDNRTSPRTSKYSSSYKWKSRGGFSANKSKYINRDSKLSDYQLKSNYYVPEESSQENIEIHEPEPISSSLSKYKRESGYGRTSKNLDYSLKYEYTPVLQTPKSRYTEAMSYKPTSSLNYTSFYSRMSEPVQKLSKPDRYSNMLPQREIRDLQVPSPGNRRFERRLKMTKEEYEMFKEFSTPKRTTRSSIVSMAL